MFSIAASLHQANAPTMFRINFQCASSYSVSTVICQFHPEPNRDITQHSCWCCLLSLKLLRFHLSGLSVFHPSEHAPTERKSSSSDTSYTSQFLLSCADRNCAWLHVHMWCLERYSHQMSNDTTQWSLSSSHISHTQTPPSCSKGYDSKVHSPISHTDTVELR